MERNEFVSQQVVDNRAVVTVIEPRMNDEEAEDRVPELFVAELLRDFVPSTERTSRSSPPRSIVAAHRKADGISKSISVEEKVGLLCQLKGNIVCCANVSSDRRACTQPWRLTPSGVRPSSQAA